MSNPGDDHSDLIVRARSVLLDAAEALADHRESLVLIGAQAIYLRTGSLRVALAEATKDSDVALDPRTVADEPLLDEAMTRAGFYCSDQPGSWLNREGIPVDLMVPEKLAGGGGRNARGARIPPHSKRATRRARGLEACLVDNEEMEVPALDPRDGRRTRLRVAGPAALLVAKVHKIAERVDAPHRLNDKDAHDAYRLLQAFDPGGLAKVFAQMRTHDDCAAVTEDALELLDELFVESPEALGPTMAGRAEEGIGEPDQVAVATSFLAQDLLSEIRALPTGGPTPTSNGRNGQGSDHATGFL